MRTKLGNNPRIRNLFTTFALGIRTNGCFFNRTEEVMKTQEIRIEDYNYSLPDERIAKFPLPKRDESKLLLYRNGEISESIFKHITDYLPQNSLMVFNNTRVIQARLLFQKETGARIEIFCLEPIEPHDYALIFQETRRCSWTCLVGNLKKWKEGTLSKTIFIKDQPVVLTADKKKSHGLLSAALRLKTCEMQNQAVTPMLCGYSQKIRFPTLLISILPNPRSLQALRSCLCRADLLRA